MAKYYYFKPSGKWKYEGKGADVPLHEWQLSHDRLRELNGGSMPGISSDGKDLIVVVVDDETSFPHIVYPLWMRVLMNRVTHRRRDL